MSQIMLDITKNFIDRITRLEMMAAMSEEECRVVTYGQSIRLKSDRRTVLAEDFNMIDMYVAHVNYAAAGEAFDLDPNIVGYFSNDQTLIVLELPPAIQFQHTTTDIIANVLTIRLTPAPGVYDPTDPQTCWATMYRVEGNALAHGVLYERDPTALFMFLPVDWKDQLKDMLREQVRHL